MGDFTVTIHGKAAHAGLDFSNGASAIVEMSRQIQRIATFTRLDRGITVSPGIIHGGTRSNVIAAECAAEIDVRFPKATDGRYLERQFASLRHPMTAGSKRRRSSGLIRGHTASGNGRRNSRCLRAARAR